LKKKKQNRDISENQFNGTIPTEIGELRKLWSLKLAFNQV